MLSGALYEESHKSSKSLLLCDTISESHNKSDTPKSKAFLLCFFFQPSSISFPKLAIARMLDTRAKLPTPVISYPFGVDT